jgi:hypothetical protein
MTTYGRLEAYLHTDLSTRWRWVVSLITWTLYPRGKSPGTHWTDGWVGRRPGLHDTEQREIVIMQNKYEGESVNRPQMDTKHKTCDIRTREIHLFLDISSTNTDTLVPSYWACFGLYPSSCMWKTKNPTTFRRLDLSPSSGGWAGQTYSVGLVRKS